MIELNVQCDCGHLSDFCDVTINDGESECAMCAAEQKTEVKPKYKKIKINDD
jgi:hypothetical protein